MTKTYYGRCSCWTLSSGTENWLNQRHLEHPKQIDYCFVLLSYRPRDQKFWISPRKKAQWVHDLFHMKLYHLNWWSWKTGCIVSCGHNWTLFFLLLISENLSETQTFSASNTNTLLNFPFSLESVIFYCQWPFHSYGVRCSLSTVREMMHCTKTKKLFSICPAPYPRKPPTGPLQSTSHPPTQMAWLVPVVARGIVTGLTNWTVHQWQFSSIRGPFSLASSRWCLLYAVVFDSYWNFRPWGNSQRQE